MHGGHGASDFTVDELFRRRAVVRLVRTRLTLPLTLMLSIRMRMAWETTRRQEVVFCCSSESSVGSYFTPQNFTPTTAFSSSSLDHYTPALDAIHSHSTHAHPTPSNPSHPYQYSSSVLFHRAAAARAQNYHVLRLHRGGRGMRSAG
jgi:hypothetical protein